MVAEGSPGVGVGERRRRGGTAEGLAVDGLSGGRVAWSRVGRLLLRSSLQQPLFVPLLFLSTSGALIIRTLTRSLPPDPVPLRPIINAPPRPGPFVVRRPLLGEGHVGPTEVPEVGSAEVLVLVRVEPEVEGVFGAFALEVEVEAVPSSPPRQL